MISALPQVFVVDDDASVRKALERLLQSAGLSVSTYASAQDYLDVFDPHAAGCIVLDLSMPGLNGLELQAMLAEKSSVLPIIFLTGNATIPDTVDALKHGAVEFFTKPVEESTLLNAIHRAIEKNRIDRLRCADRADIAQRLATLTPREAEVLAHVVSGKLNKQIGDELGTVEKTIKVHRARVMEKMQVRSLAELVVLAVEAGIKTTSRQ